MLAPVLGVIPFKGGLKSRVLAKVAKANQLA
jgi:hypothetical protein